MDVDDPDELSQVVPSNTATNLPTPVHGIGGSGGSSHSPFLTFQMMESLLEKLKLLDYEQVYCRRSHLKGLSRLHFAIQTNPGEQFNSFVGLAAWLISLVGGNMEPPQEFDDPNATIATILDSLRSIMGQGPEFPPSKLKSGCGEPCIHVLDLLADFAVKTKRSNYYELPQIPQEFASDEDEGTSLSADITTAADEETTSNPDETLDGFLLEWTGMRSANGDTWANGHQPVATGIICDSEVGADFGDDEDILIELNALGRKHCKTYDHHRDGHLDTSISEEASFVDPHGPFGGLLTASIHRLHPRGSELALGNCMSFWGARRILEASVCAGDWQLEVERVLPQLRVAIRTETKDWRSHLEQMNHHREEIESRFKDSRGHLQRLQEDLVRGLNKIGSREKFINSQVDRLLTEYRCANDRLSELKERYSLASGGITERSKVLANLSDELEHVKQEMDQRGSSMTDGSPVVRIKQAIQRLKAENVAMEIRTGVLEHTWLRMILHAREESQKPLFAATRPYQAIGGLTSLTFSRLRGGSNETGFTY